MKITKSADFALRLVMYLSSQKQAITLQVLAKQLFIPYHNLAKLVQQLSRAGILSTKKGKSGGICLAVPSHDISLKQVVDVIDGPVRLSHCLNQKVNVCEFSSTCQLKNALGDIQNKIDTLMHDVKISTLMLSN